MTEDNPYISNLTEKELEELHNLVSDFKSEVVSRLEMLESIENLEISDQIKVIGWLVDFGNDLNDRLAISKAIELGRSIDQSRLNSQSQGKLHYRLGTAFSNRASVTNYGGNQWNWEMPDVEEAIKHYRQSIQEDDFEKLPNLEQWRILTNLGNLYSIVGRFVEAFDYWNEALIRQPHWFYARGQRGVGFFHYGNLEYDEGHKTVFYKKAFDELQYAQMGRIIGILPKSTAEHFHQYKKQIAAKFESSSPSDDILDFNEHDLGNDKEEQQYRRWCLKHRLFLNTLNDVTDESIAARDILQLGQLHSERTERIITCLGLWNQLVEEYVTARYLLYEGLNPDSGHFADKDVLHMNTLDYPIHSIYGEKLKISLRTAYSIFDKIGQFINYYFDCGRDKDELDFTDIWHAERHGEELRDEFQNKQNLPLRGLYWLSMDFREWDLHIEGSLDKGGRKLAGLRNSLEHRYVKLIMGANGSDRFNDELATTLTRDELENEAMRMLRKARAGLIYLALSVNLEEETIRKPDQVTMPLQLDSLQPQPQ